MARLVTGIPPEFEKLKSFEEHSSSSSDFMKQEEQALETIEKRTTVVKQQVADSYAFYEVVKRQPLHIRWIPFCDKWTADPAWIRGLRLSDVEASERWGKYIYQSSSQEYKENE